MTNVFKKTLQFIIPYKGYAWMNVVFNIFYALFNVLSIIVFIPTLGILFGTQENVAEKPVFEGMGNIRPYVEDSLNYFLTQKIAVEGPVSALVFICILSAAIFFLKNVFRYLALYVLVYIRTGIVKDIQ
ncbi:MAG: ABC transporter ATP-binding protein, partial [Bacteroidota bacterium]